MAVLTKNQALAVIRRAYGPEIAKSLVDRLPDRLDLDDQADADLLYRYGLSRDRLFNELGGEL